MILSLFEFITLNKYRQLEEKLILFCNDLVNNILNLACFNKIFIEVIIFLHKFQLSYQILYRYIPIFS